MMGFGDRGPELPWGGVYAADVDPGWSRDKVDAWKRWATKYVDGVDYYSGEVVQADFDGNDDQGFDYGIRALLYDLNSVGYYTFGSNLASAGSDRIWLPFVAIGQGAAPPDGVYDALDRRAPGGYYAYAGEEAAQRAGEYNVGYAHESCSDPGFIPSCRHEPSRNERARADAAFCEAIRAVL